MVTDITIQRIFIIQIILKRSKKTTKMKTTYKSPKVIAEIGCNHKGEIELPKELIKVVDSGVEVVKFQKRNNKELLTVEQYNTPHPNPMHSYGDSYGAHRSF